MVPCLPSMFTDEFRSVGIEVPIIDLTTNIECSRRVAVFFEVNYPQLFSSFANALLKILGSPSSDYITINESSNGDDGFKTSITINDETIYSILHSKCFINTPGELETGVLPTSR